MLRRLALSSNVGASLPLWIVSFLILGFIHLPILLMIVFSFNTSAISVWPIKGVTLQWYGDLVRSKPILEALKNSLLVAGIATLVAGALGTLSAYAAHRLTFPGKSWLQRVVLLPLVVPGVITGTALLSTFDVLGVTLSLQTVILGHITFLIAVFFTTIFARLQRLGTSIERAAMDLGASQVRAFFSVVLPNLKLALLGASLIAFTLSFDEIAVTFFITGIENTVPMLIYSKLRTGLTPTINALATAMLVTALAPLIAVSLFRSDEER